MVAAVAARWVVGAVAAPAAGAIGRSRESSSTGTPAYLHISGTIDRSACVKPNTTLDRQAVYVRESSRERSGSPDGEPDEDLKLKLWI